MSYSPEVNVNIGHRAAQSIIRRAAENHTTLGAQMARLQISRQQYYQWTKRANAVAPSALVLARMADEGYDVLYILTGKRG